jgi:hypothetical protein
MALEPHFPQAGFNVFHVRLTHVFETHFRNQVSDARQPPR